MNTSPLRAARPRTHSGFRTAANRLRQPQDQQAARTTVEVDGTNVIVDVKTRRHFRNRDAFMILELYPGSFEGIMGVAKYQPEWNDA
jgi:hypothetical protein